LGISNFDRINRGESQWDDCKLNPNIYWTHLRTAISAILANTNTAAAASPPDGAELARELRRAMEELNGTSEEASELVCMVEEGFGLDYPATDGERPTDAEQARAEAALPGTLESLATLENRMRKELWHVAKARRGLARMARAGREQAQR
jgi:hypothetical protein